MQIEIFYSKDNADHLKAASFVREAVRNLGISAIITERETRMTSPRVVVNGFDLINSIKNLANGGGQSISYDMVEKALERSAWTGM
jgi:hypothetical protein